MGLVFTPLQVLAFATLAPSLRTEGAALFSLGRNIGAAIGVSVTTSLLAHNAQALHEVIGASVNPFNRALQALGSARDWIDPATRHGATMLDQIVNHQAQIIAYVNDYVLMIFTTLPSLLLLLLMRRPRHAPMSRGGAGERVTAGSSARGVERVRCPARSSFSSTAFRMSCNCSRLVALAIGAVTLGRAISQASATCAGVALCRAATSSSAFSTPRPRSLRYFFTPPPRGLLPRSASERYLPVRNPAASA